jgi:type IV secretion system protein VirB10
MKPSDLQLPPRATGEADIRPVVAPLRRDRSLWLFAGIAVLGAALLFAVLDGHRRALTAPAVRVRTTDRAPMPSALPPLYIPSEPPVPPPPPPPEFEPAGVVPQTAPQPAAPTAPTVVYLPAPNSASEPTPTPRAVEARASTGEVLVFDATATAAGARVSPTVAPMDAESPTVAPTAASAGASGGRVYTSQLGAHATTVPQGTLIPAVLETALDSTRPGFVRAMVSRDVPSFDGSQILIPRGTRLFGEYRADLGPGQNRAFVQWTRLVRPDGVAMTLDSPAADALGRAGIQGRVDTHFLERFGSAVLQSTLNFGVALAGRSVGDTSVIVALPGSAQGGGAAVTGSQVQPTLRVEAGASVTVFVARDLSFPSARARR